MIDGKKIAFWIIAVSAFIAFLLLLLYLFKSSELSSHRYINPEIFSSYGTLVGGLLSALFSLAGIFLLINTLDAQQANFNKQLFESKFFDLIKIHRENANDLKIGEFSGKMAFIVLQEEFKCCKKIVEAFNKDQKLDLGEDQKLNIAYLCFFFGAVGETSKTILNKRLKEQPFEKEMLFQYFQECQSECAQNINCLFGEKYKIFNGNQVRLGHYYRHLYQTVTFADEQSNKLLTYDDKYHYIKILRAQLSTQEQAFLFYNSLSDLGRPWEQAPGLPLEKQLITKYNLIKNIPDGFTSGIEVRYYYPNVQYDGDKKTNTRDELEKGYRETN
ncbi:hypothetical protein GS399_05035 [Pedobacter sp. HMF7647]|uniref:Phage abortive infection protein n=1 Tax=Hufsiella arboris TaxID=2695275 RepID=A0A7K1Y8F2_9SPHI|nr:putative phage abortive infection protein [Hufsiella arboris]MXV50328.1 hypothetical protein [Hufsiella arboris]